MSFEGFSDDGYTILPAFIPDAVLSRFESGIVRTFRIQAEKLSLRAGKWLVTYPEKLMLDDVLNEFELENKEAAYQASMLCQQLPSAKAISSDHIFAKLCGSLLDASAEDLIVTDPQPLINLPSTKRLLYRWHAEAQYYPKRRNFLNVWFPLFRDKTKENGTMWVMPGSHKVEGRAFSEYQSGPNHFIQYEIPENELTEYTPTPIEAKRGDLVIFHRNMVHSSSENTSDLPSYAGVMRVADVRGDLTLSANLAAVPYAGRVGDVSKAGLRAATF